MKKTGIAFSSGFFGFFAHAGFLSALRGMGISSAGYAGASSGAIIAAMAASGMSDIQIKEVLFSLKKSDFWDPHPLPYHLRKLIRIFKGYSGYLKGDAFCRLLEKIPSKKIEDCPFPLAVIATNLTQRKEEIFTQGNLAMAIQASGAVPGLFEPARIENCFYVDGGMVDKAPVEALADLIRPERIFVHYIASHDLKEQGNTFLKKKMTPWHIHHLAVNISRHEAYQRQVRWARDRGMEVIEVRTHTVSIGPNGLEKGPSAYEEAREETREILSPFIGSRASYIPDTL